MTATPGRILRLLLVCLAVALVAAPASSARPDDECPPTCTDPEPDPSTKPTASITGPSAYVRTDGTVVFSAAGSTGGTDAFGNDAAISKVEWDVDGNSTNGFEVNSGTALTTERSYGKGFDLGDLVARVKVTSSTGSDTDTHTIEIQNRAPSASFSSNDNTPVVGQLVTFAASATDHDSGSVGVQWDKGSGWCDVWSDVTCMSTSFSRSFDAPGTYTIKLRAHDSDGGTGEVAHQVIVRAAPTASLTTADPVVMTGESVALDASGSTGEGQLSYRWDLDGDAGNGFEVDGGQSPTRVASFPAGHRSVRVQVTDNDTATAESAPLELTVHDAPAASFTFAPTAPLTGQAVSFTATAQDADGITKVEWDLDGDTGNGFEVEGGTTAQRSYTTAGAYTVRLRVTDGRGAQRTVSETVTVKAPVTQGPPEDGGTPVPPRAGTATTPLAGGGVAQSQNGGTPATTGKGVAAAKKKTKKRCKTVKVKREGKAVKKRVCKKAKKAKKRSARRK